MSPNCTGGESETHGLFSKMKHYGFASLCFLLWLAGKDCSGDSSDEPIPVFLKVIQLLAANLALHLMIDLFREKHGLPPRTICLVSAVVCVLFTILLPWNWYPFPRSFFEVYPYFLAFGMPLTYSHQRLWRDS